MAIERVSLISSSQEAMGRNQNNALQCWYCSSSISSDAARSKSSGYAGEPVEVKRPTESGAQNTLREALIFAAVACQREGSRGRLNRGASLGLKNRGWL